MDITPLTNAVNGTANQAGDTVQDILGGAKSSMPAPPPLPPAPTADSGNSSAPLADIADAPLAPALPPVDSVSEPQPASTIPSGQTLEELEQAVASTSNEMAELPELPAAEVPDENQMPEPIAISEASDLSVVDSEHKELEMSPVSSVSDSADPELNSIKDAALKELAPIVDKLDQPPEEKFNTMVMLLQSSDDKNLVKPAFEAAKGISDESKRAQALLDVVNEVNYLERKSDEAAKS